MKRLRIGMRFAAQSASAFVKGNQHGGPLMVQGAPFSIAFRNCGIPITCMTRQMLHLRANPLALR